MKRKLISLASAALAASMLLTSASAAVLGTALRRDTVALADSVTLTETHFRDSATSRTQNEKYLTYDRTDAVRPAVIYGDSMYGRSTMAAIEKYPDSWGFSVVAGVNGSFFDFADGIPYGLVVTEGCVRSSGTLEAVGFHEDGSAVIGYPKLSVRIAYPSGYAAADINLNKVLTKSNGVVLYTRDYDAKTKNTISAYNVVVRPQKADLALNTATTAVVEKIVPDTASCEIPAGCFVLSAATDSDYAYTMSLSIGSLAVGDTVTISNTVGDGWGTVKYACAGLGLLVLDGVAQTAFSLSSAYSRAARTAVGVKSDGSVVFYTVDEAGGSSGLTLKELAQRMQELGCVTAINLDGGGSTAIRATYPASGAMETANTPSDGALRKCANFLFLVRTKTASGAAKHLFATPYNACVLSGACVDLAVKAADENYNAVALPAKVAFTADGGTVDENGRFTAGSATKDAKITMTAGDAVGTATVHVVAAPDTLAVLDEQTRKAVTSVTLLSRASLPLTASCTWADAYLHTDDACFTWSVTGGVGTVDARGTFTAATVYAETHGTLTCSVGGVIKTVSVTVTPDNPFIDTETHWAKDYIRAMYDGGVLKGSTVNGVLLFRPDDPMTRQEFIVTLMRFLGKEGSEGATLPFADGASVAPWAQAAMESAYTLGYLGGSSENGTLYCHPTAAITRQEAMTILARAQTALDPTLTADETLLAQFSDESEIAVWARSGLSVMVKTGVIAGANGKLLPRDPVTRAQVAKMLAAMAG